MIKSPGEYEAQLARQEAGTALETARLLDDAVNDLHKRLDEIAAEVQRLKRVILADSHMMYLYAQERVREQRAEGPQPDLIRHNPETGEPL